MTIEELKAKGIINGDEYNMDYASELVKAGFKIGKRLDAVWDRDSMVRSLWNKRIMILRDEEGTIVMELYPGDYREKKKVVPSEMSAGWLANKILRHPDWNGGDYDYLIRCGTEYLVDLYSSSFNDFGEPYRGGDLPL